VKKLKKSEIRFFSQLLTDYHPGLNLLALGEMMR